MSRRVGVVGMGVVASCAARVATFRDALLGQRSGIGPLRRLNADGFPVRVAGEVRFALDEYCPPSPWKEAIAGDPRRLNARLFVGALSQALAHAGWLDSRGDPVSPDAVPERRGFYASLRPEEDDDLVLERGEDDPMLAARIAASLESRGPHLMLHDACSTGTALLGEAFVDLRDGLADAAVVAAANADLTLDTLCHYTLLSALSPGAGPDACRPFDARRDGFVRAEGAAAMVLRAWDDGSPTPEGVLAEVVGYGASADAYRPTAGHPEQRGLVLAMARCLADAGIAPEGVDHVNAHGTATPMNDLHEAIALRRLLGERAALTPLTANKAITGHASFASGLIEAVASVLTLQTGIVAPTAHYIQPDPELPRLDIVAGQPREVAVDSVLSLSSAFGGLNAALLLRRVEGGRSRGEP